MLTKISSQLGVMHIGLSALVKSTYMVVVSAVKSLRTTIQPSRCHLNGSLHGIPAFQPGSSCNIFSYRVNRITVYVHHISPVKSVQTVVGKVREEQV